MTDFSQFINSPSGTLMFIILGLLVLGTLSGIFLPLLLTQHKHQGLITNLRLRVRSWWIMTGIFGLTIMLGSGAVVCLYALLSFLALREFLTITPTHRRDHRALTWAFFIILPLHYLLTFVHWYPMFLIFIPVYAFVFFPIRLVMAGEVEDFLSRTARLQWGLLVCVYFLSYIPWLMQMEFPKAENGDALHASGLLLWMIIVTQGNDVFQFAWGKALGERPLSPKVSPNKTWEGFIGGCLTAVLLGVATSFATPFGFLGGALMALMLCLLGTAGGLVMSAIKRDFKSKDWGGGIPGHGGILDRVDSLIFSAPPFFHLTSYYFGGVIPATDTHVVNLLRFWQ